MKKIKYTLLTTLVLQTQIVAGKDNCSQNSTSRFQQTAMRFLEHTRTSFDPHGEAMPYQEKTKHTSALQNNLQQLDNKTTPAIPQPATTDKKIRCFHPGISVDLEPCLTLKYGINPESFMPLQYKKYTPQAEIGITLAYKRFQYKMSLFSPEIQFSQRVHQALRFLLIPHACRTESIQIGARYLSKDGCCAVIRMNRNPVTTQYTNILSHFDLQVFSDARYRTKLGVSFTL